MSLLKQDIIWKKWINNYNTTILLELDNNNNKKYKIKIIYKGEIYLKESDNGYLPDLYLLVFLKSYLEEKNTMKSVSAI